jgi:hypothetical protein
MHRFEMGVRFAQPLREAWPRAFDLNEIAHLRIFAGLRLRRRFSLISFSCRRRLRMS